MPKQNQSFHPRVLIIDHFDDIINQIDIRTETLLENLEFSSKKRKLEDETEQTGSKLNEIREKQIEKINEIKQINLNHWSEHGNEEEYEEKWSHIINDASLEYSQKIDQIKEKDLIRFDCVLLEQPKNGINDLNLWITSWFYNQNNLEFLK